MNSAHERINLWIARLCATSRKSRKSLFSFEEDRSSVELGQKSPEDCHQPVDLCVVTVRSSNNAHSIIMAELDHYTSLIASGDTRAFGDFMAASEFTLRDSLRSFAARVDTESVVQETFLRIWQVAPRFQDDGKPHGLLRLALRIARNLAISETRRLKTGSKYTDDLEHRMRALETGEGPAPPDPILRGLIDECRARLPAQPARVLASRLRSGGRDPDKSIAERLGMTRNTFLQNFTRARKFLAQCLREHGVDIEAMIP